MKKLEKGLDGVCRGRYENEGKDEYTGVHYMIVRSSYHRST